MQLPHWLLLSALCISLSVASTPLVSSTFDTKTIQAGFTYPGVAIYGNRNIYILDIHSQSVSNLEIQVSFDSSSIVPCPSLVPYTDATIWREQYISCNSEIKDGTITLFQKLLPKGRYYLHIDGFGTNQNLMDKKSTDYFLTVNWDECSKNYWGTDCQVAAENIQMNQKTSLLISEPKIFYFESMGDENEFDFLVWQQSDNSQSICIEYQYGSPLFSEYSSSQIICSHGDVLSKAVDAYSRGFHFFKIFPEEGNELEIAFLLHQTRIDNEMNIHQAIPVDAGFSSFNINRGEQKTFSFEVEQANNVNKFIQIQCEQASICSSLEFTLAPASYIRIPEAQTIFRMDAEQEITLTLPELGSWIIVVEQSNAIAHTASFAMAISSIDSGENVNVLSKDIKEYSGRLESNSWNYFQIESTPTKSTVQLGVNSPNIMIFGNNNYILPSLMNYDQVADHQPLTIHLDFSTSSSWRIGLFNTGEPTSYTVTLDFTDVHVQRAKMVQATENTLDIQTGDQTNGADTRVSIFIWTTLVICGGLLIICTIVGIVWLKRAWKNLKESGAYDMLKNSQ